MMRLEEAAPHLMTVAEYIGYEIDGRTELIGGVIYDVAPRKEPHAFAVRALNARLAVGLDGRYTVQVQDAVAVDGWTGRSAPEIDLAVLITRRYDPMPTAADAVAFIEVCDTTYRDDRGVKVPLYTSAGVPTWLVNIPARRVESYTAHGGDARVFEIGDSIDIAGVTISVSDLFRD
jgi:hypothetical protein